MAWGIIGGVLPQYVKSKYARSQEKGCNLAHISYNYPQVDL